MRRREGGPGRKSALGRRVGSRGAASWDRFHPFGAPLPSISPHFLWCLHKCWMEERESGQSAEFFPATSLFGPGGRSPPPVGKKGEGGAVAKLGARPQVGKPWCIPVGGDTSPPASWGTARSFSFLSLETPLHHPPFPVVFLQALDGEESGLGGWVNQEPFSSHQPVRSPKGGFLHGEGC